MAANEQTWTVKAILDWCEGYLANKGDASPRHAAQYLLGEAMGLSRIELYTNFDKPLTDEERSTMREWVARRGAGERYCAVSPYGARGCAWGVDPASRDRGAGERGARALSAAEADQRACV